MSLAPIVTALLAAVLGLAWYWRPRQPLEPGVRFLLATYVVLGAWALWFGLYALPGAEPTALLLIKPTVMYWVLAATLFAAPALGWGYPVKAVFGTYFVFSTTEWRWINRGFALFCAVLGAINLVLATGYSRDDWERTRGVCWCVLACVCVCVCVCVCGGGEVENLREPLQEEHERRAVAKRRTTGAHLKDVRQFADDGPLHGPQRRVEHCVHVGANLRGPQ